MDTTPSSPSSDTPKVARHVDIFPQPDASSGYANLLWQSFSSMDGLKAEARILNEDFANFLALRLSTILQKNKMEEIKKELCEWHAAGHLRALLWAWLYLTGVRQEDQGFHVVKQCEEEIFAAAKDVLKKFHADKTTIDTSLRGNLIDVYNESRLHLLIGKDFHIFCSSNSETVIRSHRLDWWKRCDSDTRYANLVLRSEFHFPVTIDMSADMTTQLRNIAIYPPPLLDTDDAVHKIPCGLTTEQMEGHIRSIYLAEQMEQLEMNA